MTARGLVGSSALVVSLVVLGCRAPAASCPPGETVEPPPASAKPPLGAVDARIDPCVDFHAHACGPWERGAILAGNQSTLSPTRVATGAIELELRALLSEDDGSVPLRAPRRAYARCMETSADAIGELALLPEIQDAIDGVRDRETFLHAAAILLRYGVPSLFGVRLLPDLEEPARAALYLDEEGVGLPEPRMLDPEDPQGRAVAGPYLARVEHALRLRGMPEGLAADVLAFERRLARARTPRTGPYERWQASSVEDPGLGRIARHFAEGLMLDEAERVYFGALPYSTALGDIIDDTPAPVLQAYLQWHLVRALARWQPEDPWPRDVEAVLDGRSEPPPRWRRCALQVYDLFDQLGPAMGERTTPLEHRRAAGDLVESVRRSLVHRVGRASWATASLRRHAADKIGAMHVRLGPALDDEAAQSYVQTDDWLLDALLFGIRDVEHMGLGVGAPLPADRWLLPAIATSAYYDWASNTVSVGLPRLWAPLFDPEVDLARNLGTLGFTVGHEMGHAIGRMHIGVDARGRDVGDEPLVAVWERSRCVGGSYARLGEEIPSHDHARYDEALADRIGLDAVEAAYLGARGGGACVDDDDAGLRLMYTSFAQSMCEVVRPERVQGDAIDDEHSPQAVRINAVLSGRPEFRRAFGCGSRTPLGSGDVCEVW